MSKFNRPSNWPSRIVCLTAETTEILFALGAGDRIVGVSGYSVRPPEARLKEKVSAFTTARMEKIRALKPDLIFAFSDLQKDIVRDLTEEGYNVFVTNQRSLEEVGQVILATGRLLGLEARAQALWENFFGELDALEKKASEFPRRLRVYLDRRGPEDMQSPEFYRNFTDYPGDLPLEESRKYADIAGQGAARVLAVLLAVLPWSANEHAIEDVLTSPKKDKLKISDSTREFILNLKRFREENGAF